MLLFDRYEFDDAAKVTFTNDGYMVATPRVARTGIQLYYGSELGRVGDDANKVFRVLRPESSVFSKDSMASYAYKPVTDDHPPENVTADNWQKYSKGQMSGDIARDGDFIRVPMAVMDRALIDKYKQGKVEISMGYDTEISWQSGTDPKFGDYDAVQGPPRINHMAVVDAARGGHQLRIGDGTGAKVDFNVYATALDAIAKGNINRDALADVSAAHLATDSKGVMTYPIIKDGFVFLQSLRANKTDALTKKDGDALCALDNLLQRAETTSTPAVTKDGNMESVTMPKIITVDGISVEFATDQAAQIVQRALDAASTSVKDMRTQLDAANSSVTKLTKDLSDATAKHTTEIATKDAEIVTLKKAVEDSKITPAALDQMVKDRAEVAGKAAAVLGAALVVDGKSVGEIMRQVVDAKLGDKAKGWSDDQVKVSFDTMTADVKPTHVGGGSNLGDMQAAFAGSGGNGTQRQAADAAIAARDKRLQDAYKKPNGVAAN